MKLLYRALVILPLALYVAAAQDTDVVIKRDEQGLIKQLQVLQNQVKAYAVTRPVMRGAVMNDAVKGAPYSGVEISESTVVLGDGTRIHNESQTSVYRDSEGRIRRETPDEITIWDPVANTSYTLNPKTQTARNMPLALTRMVHEGKAGIALQAEAVRFTATAPPPPPPGPNVRMATETFYFNLGGKPGNVTGKTESLGKQAVEGVMADGTRESSTIEAGAIGNDRPIKTSSESWYSPELQTVIKTLHSDPRTGDEVFRLTNISRVEPAAYLFQIPPGYQVLERK